MRSKSYEPLNRPLTYKWQLLKKPDGSSALLVNANSVSPQITPDQEGDYLVSLQVSNGINKSAPAYVSLYTVSQNTKPIAENISRLYKTKLDQSLLIEASGYFDADYDTLNYNWILKEKPEGSAVIVENENCESFNFTPDIVGTYRFTLTANDGELTGNSVLYRVIVSAANGIETVSSNNDFSVYPNPVKDEAFIEFNLVKPSNVTVSITDIRGKKIISTNYGCFEPGNQIITSNFSGLSVPGGIYVINLRTNKFTLNKKVYYMPEN
jgi:uncharacterized protein YegP (UPF0339 family)